MVRRLCLGLQELRRRRAVRHRGAGLRLARPDDLGSPHPRRQDGGSRSRPRHGDPPLSRAPEGQGDLDQLDRVDLRLDPRPVAPRQARQQCRARQVRQHPGEGLRRHRRGRLHDQGPRAPGWRRPALALDNRLPRQGRREPREGAGGVSRPQFRRLGRTSSRAASQARPVRLFGPLRGDATMSIKLAVPCLLLLAGPALAADPLPDAIAAPGENVVLSVHAEGAQVYECKAGTDGKLAWGFREPIATLLSEGKTIGRHYAGPNWEHVDGSAVAAKAAGNAPGTTAADIPWLKLEVTTHRGSGVLTPVTTAQRINTHGGKLEGSCDKAGDFKSAPYSADYVFLKKG